MLVQCGLLLLLSLARTSGNIESNGLILSRGFDRSLSFSHWPSFHNGASMWKMRKRAIQDEGGPSEGGNHGISQPVTPLDPAKSSTPIGPSNLPSTTAKGGAPDDKNKTEKPKVDESKVSDKPGQLVNNTEHSTLPTVVHEKEAKNETISNQTDLDLSSPGVVKRGLIVFGGFALLAVAYFIFYRRKSSKNDSGPSHSTIDANQFRYGVLQSEDRRDNLELSRIPLTMESDEDEDDDLEIFDLEQKRKSMSYVNLQVNDEEVVNGPRIGSEENDRDNLLLDIDDPSSDALINWSSNGNKSIL